MTDIQAALGLVQLGKCQAMCDRRKKVADRYNRAFQGIEEVGIPVIRSDRTTSWHLYPIRIATDKLSISRDQFIVELKNRSVETRAFHPAAFASVLSTELRLPRWRLSGC